ncbi:MAG: signal peptidase II, partial [Oscillospiraceae bacterium]
KIQNKCLIISLVLIISGGVGNLIDRIRLGFVVDYLDFRLINFPVFNFADCCVVIGTALVLIYVFFIEPKEKKMKDMEN